MRYALTKDVTAQDDRIINAFDPSLQLRGNGRRKTAGQCPGDRYFRRKTQARRLEAAGLWLALSVRWSGDRPGFAHLPSASLDTGRSLLRAHVTKYT
jgi:hypothetical protein